MPLRQAIRASLRKGNRYYVARCLDLPIVTQGETADEAMVNLEEAIAFHLEGEDLEALGLAADHELQVDMGVDDDAWLRDLSGDEVLDILLDFGYQVAAQDGRHLKLRKLTGRGGSTAMTFPMMKELDRLTLAAIFHEASQYVPDDRLSQRFYER